ncbi:MAG: glycosyl hydrolase [Opitutae bacterium]|nr:glycosyl hydrolase [Opitutae bacterium]MBT6463115.1 glycosyl hydrolase [Opitutae bacterium]
MKIKQDLNIQNLESRLEYFWQLSGRKIQLIKECYDASIGSPVYTVKGAYTTRGWTEWTEGFRTGSAIIQFDATGDTEFLEIGEQETVDTMASHVSHIGVHDHGFNNISTYGNLRRLMLEGRTPADEGKLNFHELALKVSGAVQASRWTECEGGGFIHSFNGPHSLFVDTIRSCRILAMSHRLGHVLMGEGDQPINLLERLIAHTRSTANFSIYYGKGKDQYDIRGRTAHEAIFNTKDGAFRCPNSQQGFSGFTTWTRGLAWAMLGFPEQLEFLGTIDDVELAPLGGRSEIESYLLKAARATCDFYIENTATNGIPYWDTGAPGLVHMGDYLNRPADPYNAHEPVDSSAAAIGAQGLLRLGNYLRDKGEPAEGDRYWQAGLTTLESLMNEPYLSTDDKHQGLLLHSIYHRPNGWDYIPEGQTIPCGESSMWGDYHIREAALLVQRLARGEPYLTFFGGRPE